MAVEIADYEDRAVEVVVSMLEQEHAVVWPEVEAKAADVRWAGQQVGINPHHLTTARKRLIGQGRLLGESSRTRGGHVIETFHLTDTADRVWKPAAARKRLLQARYLGWAQGTRRHPHGLVGAGAERVVHASLLASAPAGYRIERPDGGDVREFLGMLVPGGALDSAAQLIMMDGGVPTGIAAIPIEVKNLRDWIYPHKAELFQLLAKAALLQREQPDTPMIPVLVCRRVQWTAAKMAKALGFYVIDLRRQYLVPTPDINDADLAEVRTELGYRDLLKSDEPDDVLVKHFTTSLPQHASRSAERWAQSAEVLGDFFVALRNPDLDAVERAGLMSQLRAEAAQVEGEEPGGW